MNVTVNERTPVDLELEIQAGSEELQPRLDDALRAQRKKMNLKGFRPGKVPLQIVRKMYGSALAAQVAEEVIGEIWRDEVAEDPSRDVVGQPVLTKLDFDFGEDLHAVLRFSVRPEFDLADVSETEVRRLVRPVTDKDVEEEIQRRRLRGAKEVETDGAADEQSILTIDIQEVDKESDTPIIGRRDEDQEVDLANERLRSELRDALLGKKAGDTFKVDLPHQHDHDEEHDHDDHVDRFLVTVKTVRHRMLPELDEAFIKEQTGGNKETIEDYEAMVRAELEDASRQLGEDFLREEIIGKMLAAHDIPVPEALVESVLDDMEQDLARRVGGELPEEFDRDGFRAARREAAESQARWILIQDRVMQDANMELTEEDFEVEFERLAANGPGSKEMVKQFVSAQPQIMQGIRQRLITERLFGDLAGRFTVVEVSPEDLEPENKEA